MANLREMNVRSIVDLIASDFAYKPGIQLNDLLETHPDSEQGSEASFSTSLSLLLGDELQFTKFEHTTHSRPWGGVFNGVKLTQWKVVKVIDDASDGFGAVFLKSTRQGLDGKFDYIVAFRGTDGFNKQD